MSNPDTHPNTRLGILGAALLALNAGEMVAAAESSLSASNNAPTFAVSTLTVESIGNERIFHQLIRQATNECSFIVPEELRTDATTKNLIQITPRDLSWQITIRLIDSREAHGGKDSQLCGQIMRDHPEAKDLEEFSTTVADHCGTGFHFRTGGTGTPKRVGSVLWVPFRMGWLGFELSSSEASTKLARRYFDMILLSFRSNEAGQLEVVPRSEQT